MAFIRDNWAHVSASNNVGAPNKFSYLSADTIQTALEDGYFNEVAHELLYGDIIEIVCNSLSIASFGYICSVGRDVDGNITVTQFVGTGGGQGDGNVIGAASSVANQVVTYASTTGKLLSNAANIALNNYEISTTDGSDLQIANNTNLNTSLLYNFIYSAEQLSSGKLTATQSGGFYTLDTGGAAMMMPDEDTLTSGYMVGLFNLDTSISATLVTQEGQSIIGLTSIPPLSMCLLNYPGEDIFITTIMTSGRVNASAPAGAYTSTVNDLGGDIDIAGNLTLPASGTLGSGWKCDYYNPSTSTTRFVIPQGSDTVTGITRILPLMRITVVYKTGSVFEITAAMGVLTRSQFLQITSLGGTQYYFFINAPFEGVGLRLTTQCLGGGGTCTLQIYKNGALVPGVTINATTTLSVTSLTGLVNWVAGDIISIFPSSVTALSLLAQLDYSGY